MDNGEFNVYAKEILEKKLVECREMLNELYGLTHCQHLPMYAKVVAHWEAHEKDLENKLKRFEREDR